MAKPVSPVLPTSCVRFPEVMHTGPGYLKLPTMISNDTYGVATSRWKLSFRERLAALFSGNVWVQQITGHEPLQPVKVLGHEPSIDQCL